MQDAGGRRNKPKGVLDVLASRLGIVAAVGFLVVVCISAGLYTQSVVTHLGKAHSVFEDRQIRNGYVAMSDIQRLVLVAQEASYSGGMTEELETEFRAAVDILYVRTNHLKGILIRSGFLAEQEASIDQLRGIVAIADQAIQNDFRDLEGLVEELLIASELARSHLVQFLDEMRRQADVVMQTQTRVASKQQVIVLSSLASLTFVGSVALLLLRLEILGRRAREQAEKRVQFLAFFDPLTELPNRVQFQDRLQSLLDRKDNAVALLSADLDEFKAINDTYGHAAGDAVLQRVSRIMQCHADEYAGFAARLAGDEFALVVPTDDLSSLSWLCSAIIEEISTPFEFEGELIEFSISIGLATTTQVSASMAVTVDWLSRVSDFALYASKANGRNCFTVYDETLEARFLERRAMLEELPKAIKKGDLEVYLQPKVELPSGTIFGFEALVRWQRNGKLIKPDDFILLAEESGLVVEIDNFVLNSAAKQIADWNEQHDTSLSISVNLSTLHFNSQRIIQWVEHVLWRSDIRPDLLILEITESTEMRDWDQARGIIADLRKLGCKIAIDDFGTGFSSLAYLRSMAADELKIDRSLVEELEVSQKARLMLASVFEIAQNLELDITVEGIETEQQAAIVCQMGQCRAQGYFFGRPAPSKTALATTIGQAFANRQGLAG